MSQNLEFRITASDQASAVVASVQKKIADFGKDIGRSIAAVAGPMALATLAISKVTEKMEEARQKAKEAFDWGSGLEKSARQMGVSVQDFQRIEAAAAATGFSVEEVGSAFKAASDLIARAKAGNQDAIESINAMGISMEELDSVQPEDVIRRMGEALSAAVDPADKLKVAIGALGKEGEKLQAVLAKGFDIAGALTDGTGLTKEEARYLAELNQLERAQANRARIETARQEITGRAIDDAKKIVGDMSKSAAERANAQSIIDAATRAGGFFATRVLKQDPRVQEAVVGELTRQRQQREGTTPPSQGAISAAGRLAGLATERESEAAKPETAKPPKAAPSAASMEFSSLRALGGAMAGESVIRGTEEERTQIQREIRDILARLAEQYKPGVDFTKDIAERLGPLARIFTK